MWWWALVPAATLITGPVMYYLLTVRKRRDDAEYNVLPKDATSGEPPDRYPGGKR
jgi:hypothetical protein